MACIKNLWEKVKEKVSEWIDKLFGDAPEGGPSDNNESGENKEE